MRGRRGTPRSLLKRSGLSKALQLRPIDGVFFLAWKKVSLSSVDSLSGQSKGDFAPPWQPVSAPAESATSAK